MHIKTGSMDSIVDLRATAVSGVGAATSWSVLKSADEAYPLPGLVGPLCVMEAVHEPAQPARRDFIIQVAQAFVGVGGAITIWPFLDQMNPNKATPGPEVKEVDLSAIRLGQTISVQWRGMPIFIRHRTPEETRMARSVRLTELPDGFARNAALPAKAPADDANRTKEGHDNWLVVVGMCTHMGCLLKSQEAGSAAATGEGWVCPCHAARFDLSGRVVSGPARSNLPVPPYQFLSGNRIPPWLSLVSDDARVGRWALCGKVQNSPSDFCAPWTEG